MVKDKNGNQMSGKDKVVASDDNQTKNNNQIETSTTISVEDVKNANDHADRAAFNAAAFNATFYAGTDLTRTRITI